MAYRKRVSRKAGRRQFKRTASRTNRKNMGGNRPKRGGMRL